MTEFPGTPHRFLRSVREAYGFACLRCGHAWEQVFEIEHHLDREDRPLMLYYSDGRRVPSPLARLTCLNCDQHTVRVVRAGRASAVRAALGTDPAAP